MFGAPRSGTTLLQQILDTNEQVAAPVESKIIITLKSTYFRRTNWSEKTVDSFLDDLYGEMMFSKTWYIDRTKLKTVLMAVPEHKRSFSLFCRLVYLLFEPYKPKDKVKVIIDKNPMYCYYIDMLLEIFEGSKFIHIVRDYRPNAHSNYKWFFRRSYFIYANQWKVYNKSIERVKRRMRERCYFLRYEDLVEDTEGVTRQLCEFLHIEYSPNMMNHHKKVEVVAEAIQLDIKESLHANLAKPVDKEIRDKWKSEMKPRDIALCDYVAGQYGRNYGYEPFSNKGSVGWFFRKHLSYARIAFDRRIYRSYYRTGKGTRKFIRGCTTFLYKTFGVLTVFSGELKSDYFRKKKEKEGTNRK